MSPSLALLKVFRPINLLLGAVSVVISAAILGSLGDTETLFKAIFVVVALNGGANAFNDVSDLETDRINRPSRPLPLGTISPRWTLISSFVLFAAGIAVSAFINITAFVVAAGIATPLMIAYSLWLKGQPLLGNITVSFILGLAFIFAGAAFGNPWGLLTPALLAFGFTVVRELIKDMADMEGDRTANLNTFPVRFGMGPSTRLAIVLILLLCIGTVIPFWVGIYGKGYLIVLSLGIEIPLLFIVSLLVISPSKKTCKISSQLLKGCIFAGLLAVYLG